MRTALRECRRWHALNHPGPMELSAGDHGCRDLIPATRRAVTTARSSPWIGGVASASSSGHMSTSVWQRMRAVVAFVTMIAAGCGGGQQNCSTDAFIYRDSRCDAPSIDGGARCVEVGNGDCYARCTMDGQCSTSARFCRTLGLYSGGDFVCNSSIRVCRAMDLNDCRP